MAKKNDKLILVAGATGTQGGAVLRHLQQRGFPTRAMTRDSSSPEARAILGGPRTEVVAADLDDPQSLTRALEGAFGAYSVQALTRDMEAEVRQGINLADAANRAGISHFVYSSVGSADQKTGIPHFETKFRIEEHIRNTGLPFTILRPVFFMENLLGMLSSGEEKTIALPLSSDTRLQMLAADDLGAFAAMAFESPGKWKGRTIELAGDQLSMTELAQALSQTAGRQIQYVQVPWDQFEKSAGDDLTRMFRWLEEHGYNADIAAVRREHSGLMNFNRWLHAKLQPA